MTGVVAAGGATFTPDFVKIDEFAKKFGIDAVAAGGADTDADDRAVRVAESDDTKLMEAPGGRGVGGVKAIVGIASKWEIGGALAEVPGAEPAVTVGTVTVGGCANFTKTEVGDLAGSSIGFAVADEDISETLGILGLLRENGNDAMGGSFALLVSSFKGAT